jgi:hypothetical protein
MKPIWRAITTAVLLGAFFCLTAPMHLGFVAMLLLPFFVVVWIRDLSLIFRSPAERTWRITRTALWVAAFSAIALVNLYWSHESRRYADRVVSDALAYKARTGFYPDNLGQIGIVWNDGPAQKWGLHYGTGTGGPYVSYMIPHVMFEAYVYELETRQWAYLPD